MSERLMHFNSSHSELVERSVGIVRVRKYKRDKDLFIPESELQAWLADSSLPQANRAEFLSAISQQLRTNIAAMKNYDESIQAYGVRQGEDYVDAKKKQIQAILPETSDSVGIVDDLILSIPDDLQKISQQYIEAIRTAIPEYTSLLEKYPRE